jgi:hypothetical protein
MKKGRIAAPEGVPRHSLLDAESLDHRLDVVANDGRQPQWLLSALLSRPAAVSREDVVVGIAIASGIGRAADEAIGGWQVNGIYSAQGGIPFNTSATDIGFVLGANGQRSNLVGNPYPAGFKKGINEWFNTAAYAQPSIGLFGTESRNDLRAAGVDNLDFSLFKNFSITERARLQIRGEAFNSLNHTQLAAPNTSVSSSTFGVISGVQIPGRIVQLGAKVIF